MLPSGAKSTARSEVTDEDPAFVLLIDGTSPLSFFGPPVVFPAGNTYQFLIPTGLAGVSALIQAVVFTPIASNGAFASTDAHEIQLVP